MYYAYILKSLLDGSFYIGYTSDLKRRFKERNAGKSIFTKNKLPYELFFYEAFANRKDAESRENYLKSGWGWRTIKKILKNYLNIK